MLKPLFISLGIMSTIWLINPLPLFSQSTHPADSLFTKLQQYTDSTMVLEYTSNWIGPPSLYILSKKNDTLNAYTYRNIFLDRKIRGEMIPGIRREMNPDDAYKIMITKPDINEFFHFYPIEKKAIHKFWAKLHKIAPWSLTDDSVNGFGCPPRKPEITKAGDTIFRDENIYDGGGMRLYLITKEQIKMLDYYAPDFYIRICPGRKDREGILKIGKIFKEYIRP